MKRPLWLCVSVLLGLVACSPVKPEVRSDPAGQVSPAPEVGSGARSPVLGPDANGDGLRDDVGAWISGAWQGDQARVRLNLARLQEAALSLGLPQPDGLSGGAAEWFTALFDARVCASAFLGAGEMEGFTDRLESRLINTDDRARAYVRADAQASGLMFGPDTRPCARGLPVNRGLSVD